MEVTADARNLWRRLVKKPCLYRQLREEANANLIENREMSRSMPVPDWIVSTAQLLMIVNDLVRGV
jgi:hypothetical protein